MVIAAVFEDESGYKYPGHTHKICIMESKNSKYLPWKDQGIDKYYLTNSRRQVRLPEAIEIAKNALQTPYGKEGKHLIGGADSESFFKSTDGIGFNISLANKILDEQNKKLEESYIKELEERLIKQGVVLDNPSPCNPEKAYEDKMNMLANAQSKAKRIDTTEVGEYVLPKELSDEQKLSRIAINQKQQKINRILGKDV